MAIGATLCAGLWPFFKTATFGETLINMKKIYILMALLATFAISCSKPSNEPTPKPDPKPDDEQPTPEPEPDQYVAPITVDGDFSDWDKLDASKVVVASCAENALKTGLKVLKVFVDEMYMFVYFEYDDAAIPDKSDVQGHVYFDADNNEETGGCANQWDPGCIEYMGEGHFFRNDAISSFDPSLSYWTGELHAQGWEEFEEILSSGSGLFKGDGKDGKYEMAMLLESFPATPVPLGDTFGFGMDIQQAWSSVGILPNADSNDDNPNGRSKLLTVKRP